MKKMFLALIFICFFVSLAISINASNVTRSFSLTNTQINQEIIVFLSVVVDANKSFYAIDETIPEGFVIQDLGTADNSQENHLKWVVISNAKNIVYSYSLLPIETGMFVFSGIFQFENMNEPQTVFGESNIFVGSQNLVEVGSADIPLNPTGNTPQLNIGIEPSFSVFQTNGTPVDITDMVLAYSSIKIGKQASITHFIKPKIIVKDWNPSQYYFSIDTNFGLNAGQFVEFPVLEPYLEADVNLGAPDVIKWKRIMYHWNYADSNEIVFDSNHFFVGSALAFNSVSRDFSKEFLDGFSLVKIVKKKEIVSAVFSTTLNSATGSVFLGDLVSQSARICGTGDSNVTWFDGNTYFINSDTNVDVSNCQLTIQAGAVIKYKNSATNKLRIVNKGVLKAQGTNADKIVFTSMDNNSVGENIALSDGVPSPSDYYQAVLFDSGAGVTTDVNDFFDLNFSYANNAMYFISGKNYNSIYDSNFEHNASAMLFYGSTRFNSVYGNTFTQNTGNVIAAEQLGLQGFYGNTFFDNAVSNPSFSMTATNIMSFYNNFFRKTGRIDLTTSSISNVFKNVFTDSNYGILGVSSTSFLTSVFDNNFLHNQCASCVGSGILNAGTITSLYNNRFISNSAYQTAGVYNSGSIVNVFNNLFSKNVSTDGEGGVFAIVGTESGFGGCDVTASVDYFYNNTFVASDSSGYAGSGVYINTIDGMAETCATLTNAKANVFAYNINGAALDCEYGVNFSGSYNAFYSNDGDDTCGGGSPINLTQNPFVSDDSDRNFLLNNYGIANLVDAVPSLGDNSFFQAKTTRFDNRLDYGIRDAGFHYDQNAPYIKLLSPLPNVYSKKVRIDFNLSTATSQPSNVSVSFGYSENPLFEHVILTKTLADLNCSGTPPNITKDYNCVETWATSFGNPNDGNYYVSGMATDLNGSSLSILGYSVEIDNNFSKNIVFVMQTGSNYAFFGVLAFVLFVIVLVFLYHKNVA